MPKGAGQHEGPQSCIVTPSPGSEVFVQTVGIEMLGSWELFQVLRPHSPLCCMEVEISAMMVVAALRMVEVVGAAGKPRQMSWYLPSEEEHSLIQSSRSFSKEDWHRRRSFHWVM